MAVIVMVHGLSLIRRQFSVDFMYMRRYLSNNGYDAFEDIQEESEVFYNDFL